MDDTQRRTANLDAGLYLIETFDPWTVILHRAVIGYLEQVGGAGLWIDALDNTKLFTHSTEPHDLDVELNFVRAFGAYEHHELVRTLPGNVPPNTELVVLPCLTSLYEKDDVTEREGRRYLESTLVILDETADVVDVPIVATGVAGGQYFDLARSTATLTSAIEPTDRGYRFERSTFEAAIGWEPARLETTIPDWDGPEYRRDEPTSTEELADGGFFPVSD